MSKSAKIFFLGVVVGLIVLALGYALDKQKQSALDQLVAKCERQVNEDPKSRLLVCEPTTIIQFTEQQGIQKEIAQSYWSRGNYFFWSQLLAVLLLGVFALPYAWYFLLRRVRELMNAITGK